MTNTAPTNNMRNRLLRYLNSLASHLLFFYATILCSLFIHHPYLLQNTLYLACSVVAFLITFSHTLLTLEHTSCIFVYNRKTFLENPLLNNATTRLLYFLKNFLLIASNTLLFSAVIFTLLVHVPATVSPQFFLASALFHGIYLIRDYFSSTTSLDFLSSRYTQPAHTINSSDPMWMNTTSLKLRTELLDKYESRCQFHKILGTQLDHDELSFTESTSILIQPILLKNLKTGQTIWAEKDTVLKYARQLSSWLICDHTHPAVQAKITQIRNLLLTMHDRESQFTAQFNPLRSLIQSNDFRAYNQAISITTDIDTDTPSLPAEQSSTLDTEETLSALQNQFKNIIQLAKQKKIPLEPNPQYLDYANRRAQTSSLFPICSITADNVSVPVLTTYLDYKSGEIKDSFYCDLNNLTTWIDTNQSLHTENITSSYDLCSIQQLLHELPPSSIKKHEQLEFIYSTISTGHSQNTSNPIALLVKKYQLDCSETLLDLLKTEYMKQRFHDTDFLSTLSEGKTTSERYTSFHNYLTRNKLHPLLDTIRGAYSEDLTLSCSTFNTSITSGQDSLLFEKSWPLNRNPLLSDEYSIELSLDLPLMQKIHNHAEIAISTTLLKKAQEIKLELSPEKQYYVETDDGLHRSTGESLTTSALLQLSLLKDRTAVNNDAGGYIPHSGLHFEPKPSPVRQLFSPTIRPR